MSSAGNTELPNKFDVVRVDLQPSEQYKSVSPVVHTCMGIEYICSLSMSTDTCTHKMVLAGLRPEVIMEICSRAVSFWTYQVSTRTKSVFVFDWCHIDRGDWYTSISHIVQYVYVSFPRRTRNERTRSFVLPRQWRRPSSRRGTMSSWWPSTSPRWLVSPNCVAQL